MPKPFLAPYRRLRSKLKNARLGSSNAEIFDRIYRDGMWSDDTQGGSIVSGSGTYDPAVKDYVRIVRDLIVERGITSIVEIGCGDFEIGKQYAGGVSRYVGVDVAKSVVDRNRDLYGSDTISFMNADASATDLPASDLCIIRQVLQHLSNRDISLILDRAKPHRFLLITEHLPAEGRLERPNIDKTSGPDTRIPYGSGVYVDRPPFQRNAEVILETPVQHYQSYPDEIFRTCLIRN